MVNADRPDFPLTDRHDIERAIAHVDTNYWEQLSAMLVNPSESQGASKGPKLQKPQQLSLILHDYAQSLFYVEASKFPKPHPKLKRWLAKLAERTRQHVMKRLSEVESSRRWHSLSFHGLSFTEARKVIRDAVREMHQKFSPNEGISTMPNEAEYYSLVGKQAAAYAAAGVDITSGSPLLMMAATAGRGGRQAIQPSQNTEEKRRAFVEPLLREKGWSAFQWSLEAEVAPHTVVDYLAGITKPYRKSRVKLANALGIPVNQLPE
jgi:lambda repressor-like predicted transcriptional regulator